MLLLCYNRLLGQWLEQETASLAPQVTTRTLHRHMLVVAGLSGGIDQERGQEFWVDELPGLAVDRLLADEANDDVYDEIIVDEAQDILRESYLDFLDLSVRGGLASGRWRMFGDFEKQAIYGAACVTLEELMQKRTGDVPVYSIRVNCRNTPRIAEYTHLLGGLMPGYLRVLRPDDGVEPKLHVYRDGMHQQKLLLKALTDLYEDSYRGGEIVVLSPRRDILSAAAGVDERPWKDRLRPLTVATAGQIGYGSIHMFKGMEACAVVITDIEHIKGPEATALFYVGVTRALHRLILLVHEQVRDEVLEIILSRPSSGIMAGKGQA